MAEAETKTKGAIKGGNGKFIFQMMELKLLHQVML